MTFLLSIKSFMLPVSIASSSRIRAASVSLSTIFLYALMWDMAQPTTPGVTSHFEGGSPLGA